MIKENQRCKRVTLLKSLKNIYVLIFRIHIPECIFKSNKHNNKIPFLDVLLIRNVETISTIVYCKVTNTDIYINWKSFAPNNWKWGL